eukprot:COSAG02_NODE_4792_length_4974_cov_10.374769_1_plen_87_part_10
MIERHSGHHAHHGGRRGLEEGHTYLYCRIERAVSSEEEQQEQKQQQDCEGRGFSVGRVPVVAWNRTVPGRQSLVVVVAAAAAAAAAA